MNFTNRIKRLREKLAEQQLDAILISSSENRSYFSGFLALDFARNGQSQSVSSPEVGP